MHSTLAHGILRPHFLTCPVQHNVVNRQRTRGRPVQASATVDGMPLVTTSRATHVSWISSSQRDFAAPGAEDRVLVIGGGIGGLAAAVGLTRVSCHLLVISI